MALVVLELDEEFQVSVARALVEAPQSALVATADPNSKAGQLVLADSYQEALDFAQEMIERGWSAVVFEIPSRR